MVACLTFDKVNILGIEVDAINMEQALAQMTCWIEHHLPNYIVVCPVYTIMEARRNEDLRHIIQNAGLVTPDGMPLVFISRWMGYQHVGRVYGADLMLAFSQLSAEKGYRNYFYGGIEGVAEEVAGRLSTQFQGLQVVGTYSPPFRSLTEEEALDVVERINAAKPDVVWVCLGSHKQDMWMGTFREHLHAPILVGVGAAFDMLSGRKPQAPRWMQRMALEWLFRLILEPRRLWRRYLFNNPLFMILVMLQYLRIRQFPRD